MNKLENSFSSKVAICEKLIPKKNKCKLKLKIIEDPIVNKKTENIVKNVVENIVENIEQEENKEQEENEENEDLVAQLTKNFTKINVIDSVIKDPVEKGSKKIITEDLGKIFEMAICLLYNIEFDGKFKYSMSDACKLKERIVKLKDVFPYDIKHTAKNGNQYDFTGVVDNTIKLSAKTTKKDGKVCPQVIGQPSKKKFSEFFKIDQSYNLQQIKNYIQENVQEMLSTYFKLTFDCPIVYYNQKINKLIFIKKKQDIDWSKSIIAFSHIKKNKIWNESSTISINNITIGEFQIHNHRDVIKFRWSFEKLLTMNPDNFEIIEL